MTKDEKQEILFRSWVLSGMRGYLIAATGFGKTTVGVLCIKHLPEAIIHVVVPTAYLKTQWTKVLKFHKIKNVTVFIGNTYVKEPRTCDFLIVDEVHEFTNSKAVVFSKVVLETKFKYFLGLSATLESRHLLTLYKIGAKEIGRVSLEECKANKWVADYLIVNVGLELSEEDRAYYDELHKQFNVRFASFNHNFDLAMNCLKFKTAREEFAKKIGRDEKAVFIMALNWSKNMKERKQFLYSTPSKTKAAKEIVEYVNRKSILFSQTTSFCDKTAEAIGDRAVPYHSKLSHKERQKNMKLFIDGRTKVDTIVTAEALNAGADFPDIFLALILARTSKELDSTQRFGRSLRGDKALIVNVFIKNSQDEVWLRAAVKNRKGMIWLPGGVEQLKNYLETIKYLES